MFRAAALLVCPAENLESTAQRDNQGKEVWGWASCREQELFPLVDHQGVVWNSISTVNKRQSGISTTAQPAGSAIVWSGSGTPAVADAWVFDGCVGCPTKRHLDRAIWHQCDFGCVPPVHCVQGNLSILHWTWAPLIVFELFLNAQHIALLCALPWTVSTFPTFFPALNTTRFSDINGSFLHQNNDVRKTNTSC